MILFLSLLQIKVHLQSKNQVYFNQNKCNFSMENCQGNRSTKRNLFLCFLYEWLTKAKALCWYNAYLKFYLFSTTNYVVKIKNELNCLLHKRQPKLFKSYIEVFFCWLKDSFEISNRQRNPSLNIQNTLQQTMQGFSLFFIKMSEKAYVIVHKTIKELILFLQQETKQ